MNKYILYGVIVILIAIIALNRGCGLGQKVTEKVVTKTDSTIVDSLQTKIEYLEAQPPETVKVEIEIPQPTTETTEDGTVVKTYQTSYTDSLIVARWTTAVAGQMLDQDFEYIYKPQPILKQTVTRYITTYKTKEITRTITRPQRGFLAVGGDIGMSPTEGIAGSAIIRWQASDGYSYHYRYDIFSGAHLVGITIPIRIKLF